METLMSFVVALNMAVSPAAADTVPIGNEVVVQETAQAVASAEMYLQDIGILPEDLPEDVKESSSEEPVEVPVEVPAAVPAAAQPVSVPKPKQEAAPIRELLGTYRIYAYCPCTKCTGKYPGSTGYGVTSSGAKANEGTTVAMAGLPFGTKIYIEGIGERVVQDRGVGKGIVDIYFSSHKACLQFGTRKAKVWVVK